MIFLWFSHFPMIFPWFSHPFDFGDAARSAEASAACPSRRVCPSRRRASTATTRTWPGTSTCCRRLAWWTQCIYIYIDMIYIYIIYIYKCVCIYIYMFFSLPFPEAINAATELSEFNRHMVLSRHGRSTRQRIHRAWLRICEWNPLVDLLVNQNHCNPC
jgi:hypothetical protein